MVGQIEQFFQSDAFAVVGASTDRSKFGNKVLRCFMKNDRIVYPVNPKEEVIEGLNCYSDLALLPDNVKSISIVTPPKITEQVVNEAIKKGIENIWMQPGAESKEAIEHCKKKHINVIANGPCILAISGYRDE